MATKADDYGHAKGGLDESNGAGPPAYDAPDGAVQEEKTYAYDDSRKLGVTGSVFLILNKMIGTGSEYSARPLSLAWTDNFDQSSPHRQAFSQPLGLLAYPCFSGLSVRIISKTFYAFHTFHTFHARATQMKHGTYGWCV